MGREIGRRLRHAARLQIGRGGHQDAFQGRELARAKGGIRKLADANRDVDALGDQVLPLVGNRHLHMELGMPAKELGQARDHLTRAIDDRQRQADRAAQGVHAARCVFGLSQLGQNPARAVEELGARIGHGDPPGGAEQELGAEARLQPAHDARDRGLGKPKLTRRARKAAALRRADEDRQFLEPVAHLLFE